MRNLPFFALAGLGVLAIGCSDDNLDEGRNCLAGPQSFQNVPDVVVRDASYTELCGSKVVAREGAFEQTLPAKTGECYRFEMPRRPGVYEVSVEVPGYRPFAQGGVVVDENAVVGCAGPQRVTVLLEPDAANCNASAALAFRLDLQDVNRTPVCNASVVLRDGAFERSLQSFDASGVCFWAGPLERAGAYEVTITSPGYEPLVLPAVAVAQGDNACGTLPTRLEASLTPTRAACSADVVQALDLTVRDETGAEVCDATVSARDRDFATELKPSGGRVSCYWTGLAERPGLYDLTITKPGYQPLELTNLLVTADACHVKPAVVDAPLVPAGAAPTGGLTPRRRAGRPQRGGARGVGGRRA